MFIVGLTGGIATGKSTVADMMMALGVPVIDADTLARKVVEPGRRAWHKLRKEFGDSIFLTDGYLNRERLGEIIFDDPEKRRKLNEITHPEIHRWMIWEALKYFFKGYPFVIMDVPLLYETGALSQFLHKVIVVTCEEDLQLQRLMERNLMSESKAKKRIASQMSQERKCQLANFVIENSSSLQDTKQQVTRIVSLLRSSKTHWRIRAWASLCCTGIIGLLIWLGSGYLIKLYTNTFPTRLR